MSTTACPTPTKVAHADEAAAREHMKVHQRGRWGRDLNVYRCRCGSWHVGHSVVKLRRRVRQALRSRS